ncbi:MAG: sigma-54-dependent Fis family transcriptional regulator [Deltaproteobacteria bacterium]
MAELWVVEGPNFGAHYELSGELTFGRSSTCEAVLRDRRVSRRHAQIRPEGESWQLLDLGSRNGVLLNGEKIHGRATLSEGDRIQIGFTVLAFEPPPLCRWVLGETRPMAAGDALPSERLLEAARGWEGVRSAAGLWRRVAEALGRELAAEDALLFRLSPEPRLVFWAGAGRAGAGRPGAGAAPLAAGLREGLLGDVPMASATALALGQPSSGVGLILCRAGRPFGAEEAALARALISLAADVARLVEAVRSRGGSSKLVASASTSSWSEPFRLVLDQISEAAAHQAPVLLVGEGATGRSTLARLVHQRGPRTDGPFVEVRCGGPEAWTEAIGQAEGGTLYLRELADLREAEALEAALRSLPPAPDPRLPVPVRLVACARSELADLVEQKRLSIWLAERLGGVSVVVPPLRERPTDVSALAIAMLPELCRAVGRPLPTLAAESLALLVKHPGPGNLVELRAVLTQVALSASGPMVEPYELPASVRAARSGPGPGSSLGGLVSEVERVAIASALRAAGYRKIHAAKALGISRPTLDKKIAEYGLRAKR